jgi:hypothetical protein
MAKLGSAMNRAPYILYQLKSSGDKLALVRGLEGYVALLVDLVWRHHQEPPYADIWKSYTNARYSSSEGNVKYASSVQDSANHADQLVFIIEILEKRDPETVQKEAIRKVFAIATANQSHL